MRLLCIAICISIEGTFLVATISAAEPLEIGERLELFVDDFVIDKLDGARLRLHQPTPREVVLVTDSPWEGNTCAYYTIFQDGGLYRMYYRGAHYDTEKKRAAHREVTCYAESKDGVNWTKPELGLFEFEGSKKNNIVWDGVGTHCFTPFKDANPKCPPQARYKALSRGRPQRKKGLYAFQSPDGIHWKLMREQPVITEGAFDSQNLAYWDSERGLYVDYHRGFKQGVRDVMTCTSSDFLTWTKPKYLEYTGAPRQHLYTNAIRNYARAPHIKLGFPTRFLPKQGSRVEPTLMASRDGLHFRRWVEPLIDEDAPKDRAGNRSNYMTWGLLTLPSSDKEMSVYATEAYYTGPDSRVRRFTFRVDGFVSASAGAKAGALLTKPLKFSGANLRLNYASSKGGGVRVELQDEAGAAYPGFAAADCGELTGDAIGQTVAWKGGRSAESLIGKPVRVKFILRKADVYSFRFAQ